MIKVSNILILMIIVISSLFLVHDAQAQIGPFDPIGYLLPRIPAIFQMFEQDRPGVMNRHYPYVHSPVLRGEVRFRTLFSDVRSASLRDDTGTYNVIGQFGLLNQNTILEGMVRTQLGRYSGRVHYEYPLKPLKGNNFTLEWPNWRVGMEMDMIANESWRIGVDVDTTWNQPSASYTISDVISRNPYWERPVTYGIHVVYNPLSYGTIASSFEARYRFPARDPVRLSEFEIMGGLRFPQTIFGNNTLRIGGRWTDFELNNGTACLKFNSSAVFGEWNYFF